MKTEYEKVLLPKSVQQELEKLRAQAAEIARLQSGFDELKRWVESKKHCVAMGYWEGVTNEEYVDADDLIEEINRITGVEG